MKLIEMDINQLFTTCLSYRYLKSQLDYDTEHSGYTSTDLRDNYLIVEGFHPDREFKKLKKKFRKFIKKKSSNSKVLLSSSVYSVDEWKVIFEQIHRDFEYIWLVNVITDVCDIGARVDIGSN
jgi:hypothetical protein